MDFIHTTDTVVSTTDTEAVIMVNLLEGQVAVSSVEIDDIDDRCISTINISLADNNVNCKYIKDTVDEVMETLNLKYQGISIEI